MKVMSKIITLRIITVFSLQFVQKKTCPSCKINMYVFFFHLSCVYLRGGWWRRWWRGWVAVCAFDTGQLLEDHVAVAEDQWRLILNSDAYFFPAPWARCPRCVPAFAPHLHNLTATWQLTRPLLLLSRSPHLLAQMWGKTKAYGLKCTRSYRPTISTEIIHIC